MRSNTLVWILLTTALVTPASSAQQMRKGTLDKNYGKLPLTFEANQGQTDPQVRFVSHGNGYTAFLTSGGLVLSVHAQEVTATEELANRPSTKNSKQSLNTTLQFKLLGAVQNPTVVGEDPQPGKVNYFIGNDPAKWHKNVPAYARVRYKNVYPGIDLVYYGNHQQLEYDFAVSPGADPSRIQFEITGAKQIDIDSKGNLVLRNGVGDLHFQSPIVYQEADGARVPLQGAYIIKDPTHVGFRVSTFDPSKALVIDPVLVYATYLGGTGTDQPAGIAIDSTGNAYIAGYTDAEDFPLTAQGSLRAHAPHTLISTGGTHHVFIAKLDATGSHLVYADYIGGSGDDYGYALALDSTNDVYVSGSTRSSDFPLVNPYQTYPGSFNAFLSKISADGSALLYSTYLGGNGSDQPSSIAIDSSGDLLVAGNTTSTNFPVANAYQATISPNQGGVYGNYGFLTKFSPNGSSLIYSTYLGGSSNVPLNCSIPPCWPSPTSAIQGVAVDGNGNAYAAGTTNTYDFPTTPGAYLTTDSTQQDAVIGFVSKLSSSGNLDYSTYFYESSGSLTNINAIAVDGSGAAYVTGVALSDGTFPLTSSSICDPAVYGAACGYAFVTKFDQTGSSLLYSTFLGPNNYASPVAIKLDGNNHAYVLAATSSNLFGIVSGIESYTIGSDILLVEIDATASSELLATYLGGSATGSDAPAGIAVDSIGNLYVAGSTDSTDFPVTQGAFQNLLGGNTNNYVLKIGPDSAPAVAASPWLLQYSIEPIGSTSQSQSALVRNMGSAPLSISSITTTKQDFGQTNDCGGSVAAAGSCTISVTFTPTAAGLRSGAVLIRDNAAGSPHSINLIGSGAPSDFSLASSSGSDTVKAGSSAIYHLTVSPVGGSFPDAIKLSCGGLPDHATCSISASAVTPGASPAAATLTVATLSSIAQAAPLHQNQLFYAVCIQLSGIGLVGMMLAGSRSRFMRKFRLLISLTILVPALMFMSACAGGTGIVSQTQGGTPPGTYTISVTGSSGALRHSIPLTLIVQ